MSTLGNEGRRSPLFWVMLVVVWLWVVVPFAYGLFQLVVKIPALFGS
ncbi:MFS transporter small subunit [Pseudonocardia saturnea]